MVEGGRRPLGCSWAVGSAGVEGARGVEQRWDNRQKVHG